MTNSFIENLSLEEGQSIRQDCPVCKSRNTFTATKENGQIKYNCFKLRCDFRGYSHVGMTAHEIRNLLKATKNKPDKVVIEPIVYPEYVVRPTLEHSLLKRFVARYNLQTEDIMYDVKDRRAVFPIRQKGVVVDAIGRSLDGAIPKWYRYTGKSSVFKRVLGVPNGVVVIVEDVISAITIAKYFSNVTGLAILGTSLTPEHMEYVQTYNKVIIALDPDASKKTIQYKREINSWTGLETLALSLFDDIKYEVPEDINKLKQLIY